MKLLDNDDKLDHLCIEKLELLDELIEAKYLLENTMRDGFFMMGKARYIMGTNTVSMLQVPSNECNIEPHIVSISNQESEDYFDYIHFEVRKNKPEIERGDSDFTTDGLKERKSRRDSNIEELDPEDDKNGKSLDPIKWFGGLPPQSLRQAQSHFTSAISQVARVASLQNRLISLDKKYKGLSAKS